MSSGGFGEHVASYLIKTGKEMRLLNISIPDMYVEHGSVECLLRELGMDAKSVADRILEVL